MNRWMFCFLLTIAGCAVSVSDDPTLTADIAGDTAIMVVRSRVSPAPTPKPDDDICPNCDGKGVIGDGKIEIRCPLCGGSGKRKKEKQ